jgi:MFS family permease
MAVALGGQQAPRKAEIITALNPARAIPAEHRATFLNLYLDIAWFGLLSGSAISFAAVFAARQGANGFELGLLNAVPAVTSLLLTLPAGRWLERQRAGKAVFWTALLHRLVYLPWIVLPALLAPQAQVWALIGLTLLMSIPGAALAIGFNTLFAAAVPPDWRGAVVGARNVLLAITFTVTSLLCGAILDRVPFPTGYQIVFAIGFVGGMMSTYHLWRLRHVVDQPDRLRLGRSLGDLARPGVLRAFGDGLRSAIGLRFLARSRGQPLLRGEILAGPFGRVVAVLFAFHLAQYLAIPIFPLYWVRQLRLTDQEISLGTALFYVAVLIGSSRLSRLTRRFGHFRLTVLGAVLMAAYPLLMAISQGLSLFLVTSLIGGVAWSLAGGAMPNYLLEQVPAHDRPAHLAWYNLALNAAVLLGSLGGPALAGLTAPALALTLFAGLRLVAALAIWRWGAPAGDQVAGR